MKIKRTLEIGVCWILQFFLYSSAYDNLSLGRTATQSSDFKIDRWFADRAVDGDRLTTVNPDTDSCAVSRFQREVTWTVDLGEIKSIAYIRIYYRTDGDLYESDYRGRFAGFTLYVSNTTNRIDENICFHEIQNGTNSPPPVFNTTCVRHGRYFIYFNERRPEITYPNYYRIDNAILELCEVEVYGCNALGVYGEDCSLPCPQNCQERRCNILSGECLGCVDGFLGNTCETPCPDFSYGQECNNKCGNCRDNQPCDHVTGSCSNGCAPGWQGDRCNATCNIGFYGLDCALTCSPNCVTMNACDFVNGACNGGCSAGWKPALCVEVCDNNMYGVNCSLPCGYCDENAQCYTMNGTCPNGCTSGFMGIKCEDECGPMTWGKNCEFNCSEMCINKSCNSVTGHCTQITDPESLQSSNTVWIVVGVLAAILLAATVVVSVVFFRRYRNESTEKKPTYTPKQEHESEENLQPTANIYENVDRKSNSGWGIKSSVKRLSKKPAENPDQSLKRTSKNNPENNGKQVNSRKTVVSVDFDDILLENPYGTEYINKDVIADIPIKGISEYIREKMKDDGDYFKKEYWGMPYGEKYPCDIAKEPQNSTKNRFKTTFPYDHSRVILNTDNTNTMDYINANYIDGTNRDKEYIASQGPKQNTVSDFWRMIWQENVGQIVMLTNLKEGSKIKCTKYWADEGREAIFGLFKISSMYEKRYAYYTIRKLKVSHRELKKARAVIQYHYTAWPDHGTPDPLCLVVFHKHVLRTANHKQKNFPLVVHCSAGIGRTGTYIALDALYKAGVKSKKVNVAEYVKIMRRNRMNMVQTVEQYITIFYTIEEAFKASSKIIKASNFSEYFHKLVDDTPANQSPIRNEFKHLLNIRPNYTQEDFKTAHENLGNIEPGAILPLDRFCLHLSTSVPQRGSFINAISISSFTEQQQFIVTPYPSKENVVDFLRLLIDHDSYIVISLELLENVESTSCWLPKQYEQVSVNPFEVRYRSRETIRKDLLTTVVNLANIQDSQDEIIVTVIEPTTVLDQEGLPALLTMINHLTSISKEGPITLLSRDGVSLIGLFCSVYNAVEQLGLDNEVDIFTAVRMIQVRRPELCSTVEEYQNCYKLVLDQIELGSENVYSNQ